MAEQSPGSRERLTSCRALLQGHTGALWRGGGLCSGTSDVSSKSLYLHPALWRSPGGEGDCVFPCLRPDCSRAAGSPSEKKGPLPASGDIGAHLLRHPGTSGRAARPLARLQRLGLGNHGLRAGALRQTPSPVCDQPRALSPSGRRRPLPESVAGPAGRAGCSRVCVSSRPRSFECAPSTRRRLLPASGQSPDLGPDPGSPRTRAGFQGRHRARVTSSATSFRCLMRL